jgi:hypothetical protein
LLETRELLHTYIHNLTGSRGWDEIILEVERIREIVAQLQ